MRLPSTTLLLVASLVSAGPITPRSFSRSCNGCTLSETKYLNCYCYSATGVRKETEIDLDWCITNDRGVLKQRDYGNFSKTCKWEKLEPGFKFTANCDRPSGDSVESSIDLDAFIHNSNGILMCGRVMGVEGKVPGGPNCPYPHTIC